MGLQTKILVPFFLVLIIVGMVTHFSLLPDLVGREINSRRDLEDRYLSLISTIQKPDNIYGDMSKIKRTLDQVLAERKSWLDVVLRNPQGLRLYPLSDGELGTENIDIIDKSITFNDVDYGVLTASIDFSSVSNAVRSKFLGFEFILFFLFGSGAVIGVTLLRYWVVCPLGNLSKAAKKLATGNYYADLPPESNDEIGDFVSAFKTMREGLLEREQHMKLAREVFENSGEAIVVTDKNNKIVDANQSYVVQSGYSRQEIIGKDPSISKSEEHDAKFFDDMWQSIRNDGSWSGEIWDKKKNGEIYPKHLTITIIKDDDGEVSNYIGIFRDISDLKKMEKLKGEFIATVSHELRTPLTSIKGSLALVQHLAAKVLDDTALSMIDIAHRNSDRLILLVNDILDIEKIETGQMEFKMAPLDVSQFVNEAIDAYGSYGEDREIKFELKTPPLPITINGDKNRLMQVMANLMSNAAKFSADKGIVELSTRGDADNIQILIKDYGPGIPVEFHDKIFEKFTQSDSTDSRQKGGTGLGMSITKAIVEKHGGDISFDTAPNMGTTFIIKLPTGGLQNNSAHRSITPLRH